MARIGQDLDKEGIERVLQLAAKAGFKYSVEEPPKLKRPIRGREEFFYRFRDDGGIDILIIDDQPKFYRFSENLVHGGIDLAIQDYIGGGVGVFPLLRECL